MIHTFNFNNVKYSNARSYGCVQLKRNKQRELEQIVLCTLRDGVLPRHNFKVSTKHKQTFKIKIKNAILGPSMNGFSKKRIFIHNVLTALSHINISLLLHFHHANAKLNVFARCSCVNVSLCTLCLQYI